MKGVVYPLYVFTSTIVSKSIVIQPLRIPKLSEIIRVVLGNGDILVEWRRSRVIHGNIDYFILYYKSPHDDSYYKKKIDVSTTNTSDLYLVYIRILILST